MSGTGHRIGPAENPSGRFHASSVWSPHRRVLPIRVPMLVVVHAQRHRHRPPGHDRGDIAHQLDLDVLVAHRPRGAPERGRKRCENEC